MTIPASIARKMWRYDVQFGDVTVVAHVVYRPELIDTMLSELTLSSQYQVVGIDVKTTTNHCRVITVSDLVLCIGTRCLIIRPSALILSAYKLEDFIRNKNVCFVGVQVGYKMSRLKSCYPRLQCNSSIETGHLASGILKRSDLAIFSLSQLANVAGIDSKWLCGKGNEPNNVRDGSAYSNEEVAAIVRDAYASCAIAEKLLAMT